MDLVNENMEKRKALATAIDLLYKYGKDLAKAKWEYRVTKARCIQRLMDSGTAATVARELAYGDKEVAKAGVENDLAFNLHDVCKQRIYQLKLEMGIIEEQTKREWGKIDPS